MLAIATRSKAAAVAPECGSMSDAWIPDPGQQHRTSLQFVVAPQNVRAGAGAGNEVVVR